MLRHYDSRVLKLEQLPEGEWIVEFADEILVLSYFDRVDYSIYESGEYMIAGVIEKTQGDKRFHTSGTIVEFNINDIQNIRAKDSGDLVYQAMGSGT